MSGEPVCRTKTHGDGSESWSTVEVDIYVPAGTEVEVWRAGDRPVPPTVTRDVIYESLADALTEHVWAHGTGEIDGDGIAMAADAVWELLSGQVPAPARCEVRVPTREPSVHLVPCLRERPCPAHDGQVPTEPEETP